jgi:hypothetical protein
MMTPLKAVLSVNTADAATVLTPKWRDILTKQSAVMSRQTALGKKNAWAGIDL